VSEPPPTVVARHDPRRATWALDAGVAGFAATTGALLAFGRARGDAFGSFAFIGRRIAREITLPEWANAVLGVGAHSGTSLALGALMAMLLTNLHTQVRLRSALVVVVAWEVCARIAPLAAIRADLAAGLNPGRRVALALLLGAALAFAPRVSALSHNPAQN
jgi:hypothetical protein